MKTFLFILLCISAQAMTRQEAFAKALALRDACPWPGATVRAVQPTGSMKPTLDENCYLVVGQKPWEEVSVGDILSVNRKRPFTRPLYVLHRAKVKFEKRGQKAFIIRGDNCRRSDSGTIIEADYMNTVFAIVRFDP